jgi:hypothetical protein
MGLPGGDPPLGFAGFFLLPLWSLVTGVILSRRATDTPPVIDAASSRSLAGQPV